jgi:hypothetical protein
MIKRYIRNLGEKRDLMGMLKFYAGTFLGIVLVGTVVTLVAYFVTGNEMTAEIDQEFITAVTTYVNVFCVSLVGFTIVNLKRLSKLYYLSIGVAVVMLFFVGLQLGMLPIVYLTYLDKTNE